jgi:hypothetical protein
MRSVAILLSLLAAASPALAQGVDTNPANGETVKLTVSGTLDFDWVWRSRTISAARGGFGAYGGGVGDTGRDEGAIEGFAAVRLDADLSERVRITIQFDTKRLETGANVDAQGANPEGQTLFVREAFLQFDEVIHTAVSAKVGVLTWAFDVRGTGNAFFWDPAHSGSMTRSVANGLPGGTGAPGFLRDELRPIGLQVSYTTELFTATALAMPAVIEGGNAQNDEAAYVLAGTYELQQLGRGSRVGAIVALSSLTFGTAAFSDMVTVGFEGVLRQWPITELEIFTAVYGQAGQVGSLPGAGNSVEASGWAFELGVRYNGADEETPWWVEAKYTYLSGDGHLTDDNIEAFLSYENVDDLLILHDDFFGLDWDTNLRQVIVSGGVTFSDLHLDVQATLGFVQAARDVIVAGDKSGSVGKELDVRVRLTVSKQVVCEMAGGFILGADILESMLGGSADPDADDAGFLFTVGAKARF